LRELVASAFTAIESEPGSGAVQGELCFAPGLPMFAGHFPGMPLVPGICLIEAARLLGERICGQRLQIVEVRDARFTAEVHPGDRVRVVANAQARDAQARDAQTGDAQTRGPQARDVQSEPPGSSWSCDARFTKGEAVAVARVRLVLAPLPPSADPCAP
jgi:3-hydroxymyristoyl/3-hydroxydecanoyl-(acyl carrier protein) dehydratase